MDYLRSVGAYLFQTDGFPNPATYGQGWDGVLISMFVFGRVIRFLAYVFLGLVFVLAYRAVKRGRINEAAGRVHLPRVMAFYAVSTVCEVVLNLVQWRALYWPAFRFVAVVNLVTALALFAASLKTWYAYTLCVKK